MAGRVRSQKSIVLPVGQLSFPTLFTKRAPKGSDREKYSTGFVLPAAAQDDPRFIELVEEIMAVGTEAFGTKYEAGIDKGTYQFPINYGGGEEKGYPEDAIFFNASSERRRPTVVDAAMQPITDEDDERVYGGVFARISVTVFSYDNVNKGVALGLNNVQILRPGDPFNGIRVRAEDEFAVDEDAIGDLAGLEEGNEEAEEAPAPRRGRGRPAAAARPSASTGKGGKPKNPPMTMKELMGS